MKKKIWLLLCLFLIPTFAFASTNTYQRTETDLRVPSEVKVNEYNKNDILTTPSVNEKEKIYDFGDLLTDEDEEQLLKEINEFIETYKMDFFVLTTRESTGKNTEKYLDNFYEYNYFGIGKSRDGIGLYIDLNSRIFSFNTSGKAILIYDDERLDSMIARMTSYFSSAQYTTGIKEAISMMTDYASTGKAPSNSTIDIDEYGNIVRIRSINWGITIIGSLCIAGLITFLTIRSYKKVKKANNANEYIDNKASKFYMPIDKFINTHTTKIHHPRNTGGSSGGRIGGSTIRSGGGGRSFGGRSGRF